MEPPPSPQPGKDIAGGRGLDQGTWTGHAGGGYASSRVGGCPDACVCPHAFQKIKPCTFLRFLLKSSGVTFTRLFSRTGQQLLQRDILKPQVQAHRPLACGSAARSVTTSPFLGRTHVNPRARGAGSAPCSRRHPPSNAFTTKLLPSEGCARPAHRAPGNSSPGFVQLPRRTCPRWLPLYPGSWASGATSQVQASRTLVGSLSALTSRPAPAPAAPAESHGLGGLNNTHVLHSPGGGASETQGPAGPGSQGPCARLASGHPPSVSLRGGAGLGSLPPRRRGLIPPSPPHDLV